MKNPDIILDVLKENPKEVMEALQEVQRAAYQERRQEQQKAVEDQLEEEFKNPKKPTVDESRAIFGDKKAPITIVEYSDFQCPFCARAAKTVDKILEKYPKQVRVLYKHLPLPNHPQAKPAAHYYEAIAMEDKAKAKKFHDEVFESGISSEEAIKDLVKKVGANLKKVERNLKKAEDIVEEDMKEAGKFGISGTPGFLVGGITVSGARELSHFENIINRHLAEMGQGGDDDDEDEDDDDD